jgi:subtilase family serine protease
VNIPMKLAAPVIAALTVAACSAGGSSNLPATAGLTPVQSTSIPYWKATGEAKQVCPDVPPGFAHCDVLLMGSKSGPDVAGFGPPDLQAAYNLPSSTNGAGQIVAIVDAYDNPNAATDLAMYRSEFNLGKAKFVKYNEKGEKGNYPASCSGSQTSWCLEDDLDIEMVAAICPKCTIYLVEANGANTRSLQTAEAEAVKLGAHIVSNSWGCAGSNDCVNPKFFDKPGVVYLASAGDFGYGTQAPAALASVISAGGTVLHKNGSSYTESVWPDTGVGCASGVTKPSWQHDPGCSSRTMNDVAAVALGVAEYDTFGPYHGWFTVMGTSISSPLLASIFALAGNADKVNAAEGFWTLKKKALKKDLHEITSGTVSGCPASLAGSYLCQAGTKQYKSYSAPDGWGTPNGIGAF